MAVVAHDDKGEINKGWATHHHLGKQETASQETLRLKQICGYLN
jgi:hypothetical protein